MTIIVLLFFAMVMIFQKDAPSSELQFVRNDNANIGNVHNAAQQRDYLFQDESWQTTYQWQMNTSGTIQTTNTIDTIINPNDINQLMSDVKTQTGQIYTWTVYTWTMEITTQTTQSTTATTWTLDCTTPWNEKIANNDFILAYAQRKDVNTICDIEKRVCRNWVLWGTFTQRSCQENVTYDYQKAQVLSYNQKVINEFIQPWNPVNEWATFDTQWKINTTQQPTNIRGTSNSPVTTDKTVGQTPLSTKQSCITPRGQTIKHGQFVKAYKAPRGFIDLPCDVQIRACVNGSLKWTFINAKCTFNNTSYADYLKAWSPTSNTGFLFFQRIQSALRFWR